MYVLKQACASEDVSRASTSGEFKEAWKANSGKVEKYLRKRENAAVADILVPIEILLPAGKEAADSYRDAIRDIRAARNSDKQASAAAKEKDREWVDMLRKVFEKEEYVEKKLIDWDDEKNGEKKISLNDVVSLAWIPLKLVARVFKQRTSGPENFYNDKGCCRHEVERLKGALSADTFRNSMEIAAKIPELYDLIYGKFPDCYNATGEGKFGRITAVKKENESGRKLTPYGRKKVKIKVPEGFIAPLVYGLQALMEVYERDGGEKGIRWKVTNTSDWLQLNLRDVVEDWYKVIEMNEYEPAKVGGGKECYEDAISAYNIVLGEDRAAVPTRR